MNKKEEKADTETKESKRTSIAGFGNILALGLVSFFTDISSEMSFSILPSFLLGLPGASRAVLGLIEGLAEALGYGMRSVSGIFSDKFRRRKVIVFVGYAFSTAVKPFFALAQTAIDVLMIRVGDRVGNGVRTAPRDALLSESVPEKRIGAAFGIHRTIDQMGAIIGPVLASALMVYRGYAARDVFWFSFIPGSIALFIILLFVKEQIGKSTGKTRLLTGMGTVLSGRFSLLLLVVGLFSIGAFNFSFILLKAKDVGVPEAVIPLVYSVINVAHTIIGIPAGLLSDRIGKEKVLLMGYGTFLASVLLLSITFGGALYAFLTAVVYGTYVGIVETIQRAIVPKYAPSELRGTAYGLYYLVVGGGALVANTAFGTLWDNMGLTTACSYSGIVSVIAIAGMMAFLRSEGGYRPKIEPG